MIAGRLEIELAANVARLSKDMADAKGTISGAMRDIERTVGVAARSIGAAFGAIIGAISFDAVIKAAHEAEKASLRLDAVIRATGNSAGRTREQLDAMADSMARSTQFDDEAFRTAAAHIIRFGNVSGEQFERTLKASADLAAFLGTDLVSATDSVAKAMAAPAQGIERLQRQIGYLDESQIKAIKTMAEMGDTVGAQNELLKILEGRLGGVAETMNTGYTKAIEDAKKQTQEFFEAVGKTSVVQGTTQSFLAFVADTFRDLKALIEEGDWIEKGLRLLAFAGGMRGVGNPTGGAGSADPAASAAAAAKAEADRIAKIREGLDEQDEKLTRIALDRQKKALQERLRNAEFSADAEQRAAEMSAADTAEAWKYYEEFRNEEAKRASEERLAIAKAELDANEMFAKDNAEAWMYANRQILADARAREREERAVWGGLSDLAGDFFSDLAMNGKSAFDNLRRWVKQLLADMIALFAKRWVLNLAAGGSLWGSAASALAGGAGSDTTAGGLLNGASTAFSAAGAVGSAWGAFSAGATSAGYGMAGGYAYGATAGTTAFSAGASLSGVYSALAAIPVWGWIAMAVIAIGAWIAGNHKGGDKFGGSFFSGGAVPGTDNGRFFTPSQGDSQVRQMVEATAAGYAEAIARLGGNAGAFNFGLGFDHDPQGTARSRVSSLLTDANGRQIYGTRDVEMDDKEVEAALALEAQRMLVAALQESDLHDALDALFDGIDVSTATAEQLSAVLAQAMELKNIIDVLALWDIDGLTIESIQAMNREGETLTQTLQALAQAQANYYQLFYTEEDNLARQTELLTRQLQTAGLTLPTTRDEFRAMVDAALAGGEATAGLYRWLLEIAPAVSEILPPLEDLGDTASDTADTITDAVKFIDAALNQNTRGWDDLFRNYYAGRQAREGLGGYLNDWITGESSVLDPMQRLAEAQRQYRELLALAQSGDITAISQLSGSHQNVLGLLGSVYGTASSQYGDFSRTSFDQLAGIAEVATLNERAANAAEESVALLQDTRALLLSIRDSGRMGTNVVASAVTDGARRVETAVQNLAPIGNR